MSEPSAFGSRLRQLRLAADLTLEALSAVSGVSERGISDLERGSSLSPRRATVDALASGLALDDAEAERFLRLARTARKARYSGEPIVLGPHRVNDFTGRDPEVAAIIDLLAAGAPAAPTASALIVTGAPGLGKTTIAWESISRIRDRWEAILFVDLDGFGALPLSQFQILSSLLRQMPGGEASAPATVEDAMHVWRAATAEHPVAVVLDNAASEAQVRPVLGISPDNAIIVTSRRTLSGLENVRRILLEPMRRSDSVCFLEDLIPAGQRDATAVDDIARLCDDIPLALRIVGNRIASRPSWSAADFVGHLQSEEKRLRLLVAGDLAIETAFSLSYDAMDPATARVFRAISVIDGGTFDARLAAATLGADVDDTESRLEDLTDLGLLDSRGIDRFRLHDLLRLFALQRLRAEVGTAGVNERRAGLRAWLLHTLERAGAWFEPTRSGSGLEQGDGFADAESAGAWIRSESGHWWPAMKQAAAMGEHSTVVDVADALHWYSDLWIQWGNWRDFFALAVASARAAGDEVMESTHLNYVAWAQIIECGDYSLALEIAREARAKAIAVGDATQHGWANYYIAWAQWKLGDLSAAIVAARDAVALFREAGDGDARANAIVVLAIVIAASGQHEAAIAEITQLQEALTAENPGQISIGRRVAEYSIQIRLAESSLSLDRAEEAIIAATRGLQLARMLDDQTRMSVALNRRIKGHIAAGDKVAAEADIASALEILGSKQDAHVLELLRAELR